MKTIYVEDRAYDGEMIWQMLQGEDPAGIEERWRSSGIEKEVLLKIHNGRRFEDVEPLVTTLVDARYKQDGDSVRKSIVAYQAAWEPMNDAFYSTVAEITGQAWKYPEYRVVVGLFHRGISSRDGNTVVRIAGIDPPQRQNRITAHEILMTHIWRIFDGRYPEAKEDPLQHYWAMNEITTVCLLGLEPALNGLWPEETKGYDRYLSNYPQLHGLKMDLKELYLKMNDFNGFLSSMVSSVETGYGDVNLGRHA